MNQQQVTWERYVTSWSASSPAEQRAIFERCLAPDCAYSDPLIEARGWDALGAYIQNFQRQLPGARFRTEQFIAHHDCSVARWTMLNAAGTPIGDGISYGQYDEQGRLVAMSGFWEASEAAP